MEKEDHDLWLLELIPLAEEIRHGSGTPEKSSRLAELVLLLHNHLFCGGKLPSAWFFPYASDFAIASEDPIVALDDPFPSDDSGVHGTDEFDFSCFEDPVAKTNQS